MNINGLEIKTGAFIRFMKHDVEYVGQVDYIEKDSILHGTWGDEVLNAYEENFTLLRSHDGKLTPAGEAYVTRKAMNW